MIESTKSILKGMGIPSQSGWFLLQGTNPAMSLWYFAKSHYGE